jgi:hypothetical protein
MRAIRSWRPSRPARLLVVLAAGIAVVALLASPAQAGRYVDRAVSALGRNRVYVDSGARKALPATSVTALRNRVRRADTPIYVAVLPAAALREARGSADRLAQAIVAAVRGGGTVAVSAGGHTGAASSTLDPGTAATTMRATTRAHRGDLGATMLDFVGRADAAASAGRSFWQTLWDQPLVRVIALIVVGLILVTLVNAGVTVFWRRRSRGSSAGFGEVQALAQEDIVALGDDLRNLDLGLEAESDNSLAARDYTRAYESFQQAQEAFERAEGPNDFAPVSTALEAGRYYMTLARARFEGRELPQRRPPCFFDTRHGPSVDDVGWMPKGGPPRPVPACESCMRSIADGVEPAARQVNAGGRRRMPFYDAPPHFESWFAGYFGGAAAGLVDGFPLGRALDDGYAGGLNTFGGGYGYLPVSYADTGILDPGGADIGHRQPGADTELVIRPAGHDADTEG